ncbi:MAG: hypothetical protein KJ077_24845 [Anaerolineae bacterium]|nr:hypothetical protein [Anaerolineae bacterium]
MVRKALDKEIQEALGEGRKNQQKHRYLNWCKYLHIDLLSQSEVGRMAQLPLGPHEIYCDYYTGTQSVNVELIATHFIEEHCVDCPFHEEVHPDNLGRAIVEKARERRSKLSPVLQAKQKLQELVQVTDPIAILEQDITTNRELSAILVLLENDQHKQQASEKALTVAQELGAELFSIETVRVLATYFADPKVGEKIIQIIRILCKRNVDFYDAVIESAKYAFEDGYYCEPLAYLLGDYIATTKNASMVADLIPLLMAHHTGMLGIGSRRPSEGAIYALRSIAEIDIEPISQAIQSCLEEGDKYSRLQACDTLDFLIEPYPELGERFFKPLLHSLYLEEDMYDRSADGATVQLLAQILNQNLSERLPVMEQFYENAPSNIKALVLRIYESLAEQTDDKIVLDQCISKTLHTLAAGLDYVETFEGCADFLNQLAWKRPESFLDQFDSLIGAFALIVDRPTEIRQEKANNSLEWMDREGFAAQWDGIVNRVKDAIEKVGRSKPEIVAPILRRTITNANSKTAGRFKGRLIAILGQICGRSLSETQNSIPMLFGLLVDNDSPIVRGNAARAFGDIAMYWGDILPRDVLDLLKELLWRETNVYVLLSLIEAFKTIHIPDLEFATSVCNALVAWENSFDSRWDKEKIMNTLLRVASKFETLRRALKPWLWRYCHHEDYWIRRKKLEDWYRWSQKYPEYTFYEFIQATLQFYRDFKTNTRDFNGLEQPFKDLLRIPRSEFIEHLSAIIEIGKSSQGADYIWNWNQRDFAMLLSLKEYYSESAQLYLDLIETLPAEPRYDSYRRYLQILAYKDSAEAAVLEGDLQKALDWLEEAGNFIDQGTDDLEQTQIVLRQKLLRLLNGFDLSNVETFITEVETIRRQYVVIFEEHFQEIHDVDENFFRSLDNLLEMLHYLCKWAKASLRAEDNPSRYIEAARNQLDLASDFANRSDSALFAEHLKVLLSTLESVNRVREVVSFVQQVALVPFPLIFEYRVKDNWGGSKGRQRLLKNSGLDMADEIPQPEEAEDVHVAQVQLTVEGHPPSEETPLIAGTAYGMQIKLSFARWSKQYPHLQLRFLSTSPFVNKFPNLSLDRVTNFRGNIIVNTHLVFDHPLSSAAPPIEAKLVASLVSADGSERVLDLFGAHNLNLRVLEKPQPATYDVSISNSQGIAIGDQSQVSYNSDADDMEK